MTKCRSSHRVQPMGERHTWPQGSIPDFLPLNRWHLSTHPTVNLSFPYVLGAVPGSGGCHQGMPRGACRQGTRGELVLLPRLSLGSAESLLGALCPNEVFIVHSLFPILNGTQSVKTTSTYPQMMTFKNHLLIPFRVEWAVCQ